MKKLLSCMGAVALSASLAWAGEEMHEGQAMPEHQMPGHQEEMHSGQGVQSGDFQAGQEQQFQAGKEGEQRGEIVSVDPDARTLTIRTEQGQETSFRLTEDARVFAQGEQAADLSQLQVGQNVIISTATEQGELCASRIELSGPAVAAQPGGFGGAPGGLGAEVQTGTMQTAEIVSIDTTARTLTVRTDAGTEQILHLGEDLQIGGDPQADLSTLQVGQTIRFSTDMQQDQTVVSRIELTGEGMAVGEGEGGEFAADAPEAEPLEEAGDMPAEPEGELPEEAGDLPAEGELPEETGDVPAGEPGMAPPAGEGAAPPAGEGAAAGEQTKTGEIISVDTGANSVTIQTEDGQQSSFQLSDQAQVMLSGNQKGSLSDLQVGQKVTISTSAAEGQNVASRIQVTGQAQPAGDVPSEQPAGDFPPEEKEGPPGHTGESPGVSEHAPGHTGESPGRSEEAPGHSGHMETGDEPFESEEAGDAPEEEWEDDEESPQLEEFEEESTY